MRALVHLDVALETGDLFRLFGIGGVFDVAGFDFTEEAGRAQEAAACMDQAVDEERLGAACRFALGIAFIADRGELDLLVVGAGNDVLGGEPVGDGVLGRRGFPHIGARTGGMLGVLDIGISLGIGGH